MFTYYSFDKEVYVDNLKIYNSFDKEVYVDIDISDYDYSKDI